MSTYSPDPPNDQKKTTPSAKPQGTSRGAKVIPFPVKRDGKKKPTGSGNS